MNNPAIQPCQVVWEEFDAQKHAHWLKADNPAHTARCQLAGIPVADDPNGSLPEFFLGFLHEAAEIEHDLMLEYLYSATDMADSRAADIVTHIAIEEMGHLLSVQNFILAMGQAPYVNYPKQGDNIPFPYQLRDFTLAAIAAYTMAESPDLQQLPLLTRWQMGLVSRDAQKINPDHQQRIIRVGLIYQALYDAIAKLSDQEFITIFPGASDQTYLQRQAHHTETWGKAGLDSTMLVFKIEHKADLLAAIQSISSQGEGFYYQQQSHFNRFLGVYRGMKLASWLPRCGLFKSISVRNGELRDLWQWLGLYSPYRFQTDPALTIIPAAIELFNLRYIINLLTLLQILSLPIDHVNRSPLIAVFLRDMGFILSLLAKFIRDHNGLKQLYQLPSDWTDSEFAIQDPKNRLTKLNSSLATCAGLAAELQQTYSQQYITNLLTQMAELDQQRLILIK